MPEPTRRDFLRQAGLATAVGMAGAAPRAGAQPPRRPNILFLFPDQHRWDWTPAHRVAPVPMPNLERLQARGTTFDRAYCAAPVCAPSRACLATGREYDHCGVATNSDNYPIGQPTVYQRLREAGYRSLGCGKIDLSTGEFVAGRGIGLDGRRFAREWGFTDTVCNAGKQAGAQIYFNDPVGAKDSYYVYLDGLPVPQGRICAEDFQKRNQPKKVYQWGDTSPSPLDEEHYLDNWIARNGLELLDATPAGDPWFLVVNFAGPHCPLDIPTRLERLYRGPDRVIEAFGQPNGYTGEWDAAHHTRIRQNYAAIIENIDHWIGVYLDRLQARGEIENTLIVFASDHGEMLGEHDLWGKTVPYEASVGVPLVVAGPGAGRGQRSDALVSLIDVTATFLDYGQAPPLDGMEGFSLRPLLEGRTRGHREHLLSGLYGWRLVSDGRFKLITDYDEVPERLYDLAGDPQENVNLAAKDPGRVKRLRELMRAGSYRPS